MQECARICWELTSYGIPSFRTMDMNHTSLAYIHTYLQVKTYAENPSEPKVSNQIFILVDYKSHK